MHLLRLRPEGEPGGAYACPPVASPPGGADFTRSVSVLISRPQSEVFAFVEDARNRPRWDESVDSEALTSPEPIGVGSTVLTKFRSMGRNYQYTWEIVGHEPPTHMTVESTSGPFPTTLRFNFSSRAGGTLVEASVTGRPTGLFRILEPLVARTTQKNLDQGYARLKRLLEPVQPAKHMTVSAGVAPTGARHAVRTPAPAGILVPARATAERPHPASGNSPAA
jgi:hypothetical protein